MRTTILLTCCAIALTASAAKADDITGDTFGSALDYVIIVQTDAMNSVNLTQRNKINYSAIQQYGTKNTATVLQVGGTNGSGIKQRNSPPPFSTNSDFTYLYAYRSGGVSVTAITPFPLAAATYGRAH